MTASARQPKIDARQADDLLHDLLARIPRHFEKWKPEEGFPAERSEVLALAEDRDDVGMALLKMAARMHEVIVEQLNRVPQKNFLAFLDFMGIDPYPPTPARVPLTFALAEGAKAAGFVPAGARVGAVDAETLYETDADLTVNAVRPKRLVSLHPATDQSTEHPLAGDGTALGDAVLFHGDANEQRLEHTLWLGHRRLLGFAESFALSIRLQLGAPASPFADFIRTLRWEVSPDWTLRVPQVEIAGTEVVLRLQNVSAIGEMQLAAVDAADRERKYASRWIRARATQAVPGGLPDIRALHITASQRVNDAAPDLAFANGSPVDLSKDFYPFGERPKFNDSFYFASESIFSKSGARIAIRVALTAGLPAPNTAKVTLNWEYWDGKVWASLGQARIPAPQSAGASGDFADGSNALKQGGDITFTCPKIAKVGVNGKENYWIRVRIVEGDYGVEAQLSLTKAGEDKKPEERTLADYEYRPASFAPPSLASMTISSVYEESAPPEVCLVSAASLYRDVTGVLPIPLAEPAAETAPTVYVGLSGLESPPAASISLYFQLRARRFDEARPRVTSAAPNAEPLSLWEYWTGAIWARLAVEDGTQDLARPGLVKFDRPSDMAARALFGERLAWVRARLLSGGRSGPRLGGIFPNTVWATQAQTVDNEVLGSSNGEPNQEFRLARAPVLDGELIEVREPVTGTWVQWRRVDRFAASGPGDRHYVLDRAAGRLIFGDGVNGLVPPAGQGDVRALRYRSGGGSAGNRPQGTITALKKTYPFVDSVTNHEPAAGGLDREGLDQVMKRGPHSIKNRGRAVTTEDFEWVARQASGQVARARCLANTRLGASGALLESPGWVTLVIVPDEAGDRPMPVDTLLSTVKAAVAQHCLASLAERIDVVGPLYVELTVDATVVARRDIEEKILERRLDANLKRFLHPLQGGFDGGGWDFGRSVSLPEIMRVVRATPGVDRVLSIGLRSADGMPVQSVTFPQWGMPCSGRHAVTVVRR